MSYVYKSVITLKQKEGYKWNPDDDISSLKIFEIFRTYIEAYILVSHTVTKQEQYVRLSDLRNIVANTNHTLQEFFDFNGNKSLPIAGSAVEIKNTHVKYYDVWNTKLDDIQPTIMGKSPETNWNISDCKDLLLKKSADFLDYDKIAKHSIFTVNGLVHRSSFSEYGIYIQDAATSNKIAADTRIGCLSFEDIGEIETIGIDKSMLKMGSSDQYSDNCILDLGQDLTNKTVLLSICGYLHILDNFYNIFNIEEGLIRLDFTKYPLMQRHFDLLKLINIDGLDYQSVRDDKEQVITNSIMRSDSYIESMMDMSQTFAIVIDTPLYKERSVMEATNIPGVFKGQSFDYQPMMSQRGRFKEYIIREHKAVDVDLPQPIKHYLFYVNETYIDNYLFDKSEYLNNVSTRNNRDPSKPEIEDDLYEIIIGSSKLTISD